MNYKTIKCPNCGYIYTVNIEEFNSMDEEMCSQCECEFYPDENLA